MALRFSDDQRALADAIADVLSEYVDGPRARADSASDEGWRRVWTPLGELGATTVLIPERAGGLGLGLPELVAVLECAGRFPLAAPLVSTAAMFTPFAVASEEPGIVLDRLVDGAVGVLGLDERAGGARGARVRFDDHGVTLEGVLTADAARADLLALVGLADDGEERACIVEAASVTLSPLDGMDVLQPLALVSGTVSLEELYMVPDPAAALDTARTGLAAHLLGVSDRLVGLAVEQARTRHQFGKAIGGFQAVKHPVVDRHVETELARSLVYRAAVDPTDATSSAALTAAAEAAEAAARTAVQVHGGMGITREHDVSLFYLRARQGAKLLASR